MLFKMAVLMSSLVATGCATNMVMKPEVDNVKTVAVISVYSNATVKNIDGPSAMDKVGGMASLAGLSGNGANNHDSSIAKTLDFGGTRLVEHGIADLEMKLEKVKGWKVRSHKEFISSDAFSKFVENMNDLTKKERGLMGKMSGPQETTVPGMPRIPSSKEFIDKRTAIFAKLARDLNVDAVAVSSLHLGYKLTNGIAGNGTAAAVVGSNLEIYNKQGQTAVKGALQNIKSSDTVPMVAGNIMFNDTSEKVFKQAISSANNVYLEKINAEL